MTLYDITIPLEERVAVFPGDTPYSFELIQEQRRGASVNLGSMTLSVHAGTHADAPFHFLEEGDPIDQVPLDPYIGPALVVDVAGKDPIRIEDLPEVDLSRTPRLLLLTGAWQDPTRFPDRIPVLAPEVPEYLEEHGVVLLGVDVPSVDPLDSEELPLHRALAAAGIHILESLRLDGVPAGEYELIALPLRLTGADGAPVRAILRQPPAG